MDIWATPPSKKRRLDNNIIAFDYHGFLAQGESSTQTLPPTLPLKPNSLEEDCCIDTLCANVSTADDDSDKLGPEPAECCFGMLCDIPVKPKIGVANSNKIPLYFQKPRYLYSTNCHGSSPTGFEIQCGISAAILAEFEAVPEVKTQLYCYSKLEQAPLQGNARQNGRKRGGLGQLWFLNIILFGAEGLEDHIGDYLSRRKMYLQDPLGCERCVPYRNPHIVSSGSDEMVMTDSFDNLMANPEIEQLEEGPDLLAQLMENEVPLPETEAPESVRTTLFKHQKQALTFMMRREEGWNFKNTQDIWSSQINAVGQTSSFTNNINGNTIYEQPPNFRGGLLADEMGLGKTLSMICLIASSHDQQVTSESIVSRNLVSKTTLLVVPPALIQTWETQFNLHLNQGTLKWYVYHGQNRKGADSLGLFDVVITTYHTISAIWRKVNGQAESSSSIFSLSWYRIILDEAHIVQNPKSQLAKACCALRSSRRWAISGTPIQNKLADFASIVKFLQVHPYSDQKAFDEDIVRPWQRRNGTDPQGFLRLKTLVRAITISRTKTVVALPSRLDEIHRLNFTSEEREKYDDVRTRSRVLLDEAINSGTQSGKALNALWLLNILRLICNHGILAQNTLEHKPSHQRPNNLTKLSLFESYSFPTGDILDVASSCYICGSNMMQDLLEGSESSGLNCWRSAAPDQTICENCRSLGPGTDKLSPWSYREQPGSTESSSPTTPDASSDEATTVDLMSSKIKALIADVCKHSTAEKSVIFSYWTTTLNFIQLMLKDKNIAYSRIDGKSSLTKRNEAVRAFQHDASIRVILVSITCGGAGLDLTAGSRAYILEPHWNPMIEEQALCRVHRVGQKRGVTTIRYLMRDSFEEQMVDIQKKKKKLAQVAFAQGPLTEDGIGIGTLQYLKSVLG